MPRLYGPNGQRSPTILETIFILIRAKLGLPQTSLQLGKEMGEGLSVVPYMCRCAGYPTSVWEDLHHCAFPSPQSAVGLPKHRGGFQDGQIRRDGLNYFRRQRGVIERL